MDQEAEMPKFPELFRRANYNVYSATVEKTYLTRGSKFENWGVLVVCEQGGPGTFFVNDKAIDKLASISEEHSQHEAAQRLQDAARKLRDKLISASKSNG